MKNMLFYKRTYKPNESVITKKRIIHYGLVLLVALQSCASVDKYNAQINTPRSVQDLKSDIDYIQHKLQKLHPDLYHYISKKELDYKFDSLRTSITTPLSSNDFYFRLSPVIASIKQGHTQINPLTKKLKSAEKKNVSSKGTTPLSLFDFELFDNKLYITKNYSKDSSIYAGTEVLAVNGTKPAELLNKYKPTFTSDGFNTTFINYRLAKGFSRYFYNENGLMDSISCELKYKDSIRTLVLRKQVKAIPSTIKKTKEQIAAAKKLQKEESKRKRLYGYDALKRTYSKQLSFPAKDSSIAVIKIADFVKGNYRKFYKNSFRKLDSLKTQTLVIDLRNNTGGALRDVSHLYSYLADSSFRFVTKSEVSSKTSLWHTVSFKNKPLWQQAAQTIFIPFIIGADVYSFLATNKGKDGKYRFPFPESKLAHPKAGRFKGKVYVLINGGSFSASSLLSSNLQGSKRATFIGQETGGAYNGCVAGIMPVLTLPTSKLTIRFGLLVCQSSFQSKTDGYGILPDKEINPTVQDRINGIDPELEWILKEELNKTK
jgi:C-terminal processing protease CtpA/Prc